MQEIVNSWHDPEGASGDEFNDGASSRNESPAGNGLRLDGSSRNGSSSAFAAGAVVQRGGGSVGAGSLALNGAAVGTRGADHHDDEELEDQLPSYKGFDEGYDEPMNMNSYAPTWGFGSITRDEDNASDQVNTGDVESLEDRLGDFADQDDFAENLYESGPAGAAGANTPLLSAGQIDDGEDVAEIRV